MSISKKDVEKLAELARIQVTTKEAESLAEKIDSILGYVEQVGKVDTSDQAPKAEEVRNIMREDDSPHDAGIYSKELLSEAPEVADAKEGTYVRVQKIL